MIGVLVNRLVHRIGFQVLRVWWFLARPQTHGVKMVLWEDGRILFVRHTYGDREAWELPGGGRRRGEEPDAAARREAREELGVDIGTWRRFGEIVSREHATANLICMTAAHDGAPLRISRGELAEVRWCAPTDPPRPLGRHAAEILELPAFPGGPP